jgi:hypothetical protein
VDRAKIIVDQFYSVLIFGSLAANIALAFGHKKRTITRPCSFYYFSLTPAAAYMGGAFLKRRSNTITAVSRNASTSATVIMSELGIVSPPSVLRIGATI